MWHPPVDDGNRRGAVAQRDRTTDLFRSAFLSLSWRACLDPPVRSRRAFSEQTTMSSELLPFPFIDYAVRAAAILILCVLPVLMVQVPPEAWLL